MARQFYLVCGIYLAAVMVLSGCSKKKDIPSSSPESSSSSQPVPPVLDSPPAAALDKTLELWRAGQKEQAADLFLQINWNAAGLFSRESVFRISEDQFKKLPEQRRLEISQKALLESASIKELTQYLVKQAKQPGADIEKYRHALSACARRLSADDQLAIIVLVAKAVSEYAAKELN